MANLIIVGVVLAGTVLVSADAVAESSTSPQAASSSVNAVSVEKQEAKKVSSMGTSYASLKTTTNAPVVPENKNLKNVDFEIQRGQYVFVGYDAGTKERYDVEHGMDPRFLVTVARQSAEEKMTMRVSVDLKDGKLASFPWNFKAALFTRKDHEGPTTSWHDTHNPYVRLSPGGNKRLVELVPVAVEEVNVLDAKVKKYKIPYLKVDGETRYIVVIIGDKQEDVKAAVKIPRVFVFFKWENVFDECK